MITTSDERIAEQARILRFHGSRDKVDYEQVGYNSRLDELQAAILRTQLPHLDGWAAGRRQAGQHYAEAGLGELVALPVATSGASPAWHLYVVSQRGPSGSKARWPQRRSEQGLLPRPSTVRRRCAMGWMSSWSRRTCPHPPRIPMSPVLTGEQAAAVTDAARAVLAAQA